MPAVLEIDALRFSWGGGFGLSLQSFEIERGERVLLVGPSGSGKSTLLALICGIATPDSGRLSLLGQDLGALTGPARDRFRAEHIGVIFQMFNLLAYASAVDNVLLPLNFAPRRRARLGAGAAAEARRIMAALGLSEAAIEARRAAQLSVGQQQRVAAARALIGAPEIIVADEPTSALDTDSQDAFLQLLFAQLAAREGSLLMVSHDSRLSPRFDRVVRLGDILVGGAPKVSQEAAG
ncbi:MAG: ABC transporter ATP-binding protein [Pikeienuella sp.]